MPPFTGKNSLRQSLEESLIRAGFAFIALMVGIVIWQTRDIDDPGDHTNPRKSTIEAVPEAQIDAINAALMLKRALGEALKQQLEQKGPAGALNYCSLEATPLTAQISETAGFAISRITDRPAQRWQLSQQGRT